MNVSELDRFLRLSKEYEVTYYKTENPPLLVFHNESESILEANYDEEIKKVYHLSDSLIMGASQSIACNQHYRYLRIVSHYHPFIELIYVYSGKCTQTINGQTIHMTKGDICILDLNVVHNIHVAGENDIIINILMRKAYFDKTMLGRLSGNSLLTNFFIRALYERKNAEDFMVARTSENTKVETFMNELMCEFFDKNICSEEAINSYMVLIFTEILREYEKNQLNKQFTASKKYNMNEILQFLEENYRDITLVSVAQHFHFHPNYLSRILKKYFGVTFTRLIQDIRLNRASHLLEMQDVPVNRIANEVGFSNIHFFYNLFKEKYGVTPSKYRKLKKEMN